MENLFRLMQKSDYESVYSLWMKCKNMGFNNVDDSEKGISKYLERNSKTCFVCIRNEKVVGVILSGHDGRRGFIHHLAVDPDCRRQGIATELLRQALNALKAEEISKVGLLFLHIIQTEMPFGKSRDLLCALILIIAIKLWLNL